MPLATICGLPASGKTTFAEGLVAFLREELESGGGGGHRRVVLVNEESLRIGKAQGYRGPLRFPLSVWGAVHRSIPPTPSTRPPIPINCHGGAPTDTHADAVSEKETRGALRAAVDHALDGRTVVVLDSLNYIKGFRYQLYCAARAESTQHCVVRGVCGWTGACLPLAEGGQWAGCLWLGWRGRMIRSTPR